MEVKFENQISETLSTKLNISKIDSGVFISISTIEVNEPTTENTHFLSKKELSDYIGILLHIQSKLR
jgi:hypothetical protein